MSNTERLPALGPGTERQRYIPTIYDFLRRRIPEPDYYMFSDRFYLSELTPLLRNISAFDHEVFVHSDEERARLLDKEETTDDSFLEKIMGRKSEEKKQRRADKRAQGERFSLITYDYEEEAWYSEEPVGGSYYNVSFGGEYYARLKEARLPVLEVHSHPDNALFSPLDYTNLITDMGNKRRFYRGAIVLCPDIQILALTTRQTPLLGVDKAAELTEKWFDDISNFDTPQLRKLRERYEAITAFTNTYFDGVDEEFNTQLEQLEAMHNEHPLDEEAYLDAVMSIVYQLHPSFDEDLARHNRMRKNAATKYNDLSERHLNAENLAIARNLNIRLYSSQNMTDFIAFSA